MQHIGFGLWNWIAVIVYLVAMLLVGAYFTKRASQDTDSFFKKRTFTIVGNWLFYLCDYIKCNYVYVYT